MNVSLQSFEFRQNKLLFLGAILCAYFAYHLFYGPRSLPQLQIIQSQNAVLSEELSILQNQEKDLGSKVVKLRPETLDHDLLKERAREMLGYVSEGEIILMDD